MALQRCGITVDKTSKELQAHGTADFPCGGYDSIYRKNGEKPYPGTGTKRWKWSLSRRGLSP